MYIAFIFTISANFNAFPVPNSYTHIIAETKSRQNAQKVMNVRVSGRCASIKIKFFLFPDRVAVGLSTKKKPIKR